MAKQRDPATFNKATQAALQAYINELFVKETETQMQVRQSAADYDLPQIELRPYEGQFLMWLATLVGAQRIVEIGTLAGYSATWLARALPIDGKLICLEKSQKAADIARQNFELVGIDHLIDLIVGDAHQMLKTLEGPFDMVFIDAEKSGYAAYLDWAMDNVRERGIIAAHNAFQGGDILDEGTANPEVQAMQAFNRRLTEEFSLLPSIYPAGDGILVAMKLP
ncbi:MAG: O-methyltransferase [Anaerolineales bacterium]